LRTADLVAHVGFDSIQLLRLWATLEQQYALPAGMLGVSQATTIDAIAVELARLRAPADVGDVVLPLTREQIATLIPHRPPMLMLDQVIKLEPGHYGMGHTHLAQDDPRFAGHFPGRPILPGIYVVEACGQLTAVVCRFVAASRRDPSLPVEQPIEYLASIERFKFLSPVLPGEVLVSETFIGRSAGQLLQVRVCARSQSRAVAEGTLIVTQNYKEASRKRRGHGSEYAANN
jgi:3-hydroxyacyl-[acyl-carrier-protein] dehydratase